MEQSWILFLLPLLFPLVFLAFWSSVLLLLSAFGGWRRMAQLYATDQAPTGKVASMVSGMVGWVSYRNVLKVSAEQTGLYLAVFGLFRPGHPPLLLPYYDIKSVERSQGFWQPLLLITVGRAETIARLRLPEKLFKDSPLAERLTR